MSLYTLKELNNKPADIIRSLLLEGYRVVPTEQSNKKEFIAVLTNDRYTVKIITHCSYDHFVIIYNAKNIETEGK